MSIGGGGRKPPPFFLKAEIFMPSIFDIERQHRDVDSKIAAALERLTQAFRVLLWEKNKTENLSPIQIQLLVYLLYHPADKATLGQLAREFTLTPATISDAITTLEKKTLVTRKWQKTDRRVAVANLTTEGRKTARKLSTWANLLRENLTRVGSSEKAIVLKVLMQLIASLQQAGVITVARMCITCKYFQPHAHPHTHHCRLLDKPLREDELRLDCAEQEAAEDGEAAVLNSSL